VARFAKRQQDFGSNFLNFLKEPPPAIKEEGKEEVFHWDAMLFGDSLGRLIIGEMTLNQITGVRIIKFESSGFVDFTNYIFIKRSFCVL